MLNDPKIIFADEPTGALDTKTSEEIMNLIHDLNEQGTTIVIVTYDMEVSNQFSRIIEISDEKNLK